MSNKSNIYLIYYRKESMVQAVGDDIRVIAGGLQRRRDGEQG
jgi:hypothetical protein